MSGLRFEIADALAHPTAAMPTVVFRLRVLYSGEARVDALALHVQVQIQPRKRRYGPDEERRLNDLFGEPARWGETLNPVHWAIVDATVPSFTSHVEIDLPVTFGYDFEVASNRYLDALEDGDVPLLFLFSGTIFTAGERGMQVARVPWNLEAAYRLPVSICREAIDQHFPNAAWIRMRKDLFEELCRFKTAGCYASWDRAIEALLEGARTRP